MPESPAHRLDPIPGSPEYEAGTKDDASTPKVFGDEAKKVVDNYVDNPSDISGSVVNIHQNSPFLDTDENDEPTFSGSRWRHVIKRN